MIYTYHLFCINFQMLTLSILASTNFRLTKLIILWNMKWMFNVVLNITYTRKCHWRNLICITQIAFPVLYREYSVSHIQSSKTSDLICFLSDLR